MSIILFLAIHISIGLALIYSHGRLPRNVTVILTVFFMMSFLYWGAVILTMTI